MTKPSPPPVPMATEDPSLAEYQADKMILINFHLAYKHAVNPFVWKGQAISMSVFSQLRIAGIKVKDLKDGGVTFPILVSNYNDTAIVDILNISELNQFFDIGYIQAYNLHQEATNVKKDVLAATDEASVDAAADPYLAS